MPRYGSRYARRYRRYKRFYRMFGGRRYRRRFVNGSSKSSIRVKVPKSFNMSWTQSANATATGVSRLCPWDSTVSYASVLSSDLYRTYCTLYDEVKCIGMKVKINISSAVGGSDIPSLQIWTAWDRRIGVNEASPSAADMKTYSTYQVATAVNNSVAKLERSIYASDLLEKAQWHDCTLSALPGSYDLAYSAAGDNPNFFVPAMFVCMSVPDKTSQVTITGTVDIMYYFSFRNPKYGATSSSKDSFSVDVLPRAMDPPGDEDDMDQNDGALSDDGAIDEDEAAAPSALERRQRSMGTSGVLTANPNPSSAKRVRISKNVK